VCGVRDDYGAERAVASDYGGGGGGGGGGDGQLPPPLP